MQNKRQGEVIDRPMSRNLSFNAIDVETANSNTSSICQIGVVRVNEGQVDSCFSTLVNPEERFSSFNIRIHGIRALRGPERPGL